MRCNNCGKTVPNTTINCPYCSKQIDPNQVFVEQTVIEEQVPKNNKEKILEFVKNKENKKIVYGFAIIAIFIIILLFVGISKIFGSGNKINNQIFNKFMSDTYDDVIDMFFPSNGNAGKYTLTFSANDKQSHYEGTYNLKLLDRYFYLTAAKSDQSTDDIIISDDDNFEIETYLLQNKLYINSSDFYNTELYYELPDSLKLLSTNKLNVKNLTNGIYDTLYEILGNMNYSTSKQEIEIGNTKIKTNKLTYTFDKNTQLDIIKEAAEILKEDSSFINEYSKMSGKNKNDVISMIDGYKSTLTYKVKNSNADSSYLNVYFTSNGVKRIEIVINTSSSDNYIISLSLGNNTDYIKVKKNKSDYINFTITRNDKELSNGIHKTFSFNYKGVDNNISGDLALDTENHPNISKHTPTETAQNAYNLSMEDKQLIKSNTYSLTGYDWFNNLIEYVKPICSSDLTCTCNDETETCSCNRGTTFVVCSKKDIEKNE